MDIKISVQMVENISKLSKTLIVVMNHLYEVSGKAFNQEHEMAEDIIRECDKYLEEYR